MFRATLRWMLLIFALMFSACSSSETPTVSPLITPTNLASNPDEITPTVPPYPIAEPTATNNPTTELPEPGEDTIDAAKPIDNFWGIHIHQLDSEEQMSLGKATGVRWTRFDQFNWDLIEPVNQDPKNYLWETVNEEELVNTVANGFEPIGIVLFSPEWAQKYPGSACGPVVQDALDDFAEFMQALVSRYSALPYNVRYWEIGNEPDIDRAYVPGHSGYGCWGEQDAPYYGGEYYAEMLKVVYPAIKEADPSAKVLVGGLLLDCDPVNPPESPPGSGNLSDCSPSTFLEGILASGGGDYFDGVSFHAYDYYFGEPGVYGNLNWHATWDSSGPVLNQKTRYLRELLNKYGYPDKELLNTEVALLCGSDGKESVCQTPEFQNTKAYYLVQANTAAIANNLQGNIWYSLTGWRASGLVDGQLTPYPAYDALSFNREMLQGAIFEDEISGLPEVKTYAFARGDGRIWLMWSVNGAEVPVQLPAAPTAVYGVFGNEIVMEGDPAGVTVSIAPIYVLWDS